MSQSLHVIFGTGPVGLAIMDALCAERQSNIRMVNRSGKTSEPLPEGVELVNGDASDAAFVLEAAQGADYIYNALNPRYSQWLELFPGLQANLIAAAEANGSKLVVMENLYGYGDPNGESMTEETPLNVHTRKGMLRREMYHDLMAAHNEGRVQVVVGRASDFIGARVQVSMMGGDTVIVPLLNGKAAQIMGNVDMPHSYTYMPDIGRGLVALALADDTYGQVWHLPTSPALTTRQLLEMICEQAGVQYKTMVLHPWLLRFFGLFNPDAGELVEMIYEFETPFIVDDSKFRARFGWGATDNETVIRETVAWFQQAAH